MTLRFDTMQQEEELLTLLTEVLEWIKSQDRFDSEGVLTRIKLFSQSYQDYPQYRKQIASLLNDKGWPEQALKMMKYLNDNGEFSSDLVREVTLGTYSVGWNFTNTSQELALKMAKAGVLKVLLENIAEKPPPYNLDSKHVVTLLTCSLGTLYNMSQVSEINLLFRENNAVQILLPLITCGNERLQVLTSMVAANAAQESEHHLLCEAGCVNLILKCLSSALANKEDHEYYGLTATQLLLGLTNLAVNDENKQKIVDEGCLQSLITMMEGDIEEEQSVAAGCVWTLSFHRETRMNLLQDASWMDALEKLADSTNTEVKINAKGALWQISDRLVNIADKPCDEIDAKLVQKKYIFISYNHSHQTDVKKLADRLKADGYCVWIDMDQMSGDMIEAMAEAIQNSQAMIMCMSERYKLSPYCQSEATYAQTLRIPILPVMLQSHYTPDGWLGFILGAKLYVNLDGTFEFEEAYKKIVKELCNVLHEGSPEETSDHAHSSKNSERVSDDTSVTKPALKSSVRSWTPEQVEEWLTQSRLQQY